MPSFTFDRSRTVFAATDASDGATPPSVVPRGFRPRALPAVAEASDVKAPPSVVSRGSRPQALASADASDVTAPPSVVPRGTRKVSDLVAVWAQRSEEIQPVVKKSSLGGLNRLAPGHVRAKVQQFSRSAVENTGVPVEAGLVKKRIASFSQARAACEFVLRRLQETPATTQPPKASESELVSSPAALPPPSAAAATAIPSSSSSSSSSASQTCETESQVLMREIQEMEIMSESAGRHFDDWHSECLTPDQFPRVRAPTLFQSDTGLSVGVTAVAPLPAGTAKVFGTRRYRRGSLLSEDEFAVEEATRVPRRLTGDTHWLNRGSKPSFAGTSDGPGSPAAPTLLAGTRSLRKPMSALPIAKYYINAYDPAKGDVSPQKVTKRMVTPPAPLHPSPAFRHPVDDNNGWIQYRTSSRFGIFAPRPRLVRKLKFGANPPAVLPKTRRRTPPEATLDFFLKLWSTGMRRSSK